MIPSVTGDTHALGGSLATIIQSESNLIGSSTMSQLSSGTNTAFPGTSERILTQPTITTGGNTKQIAISLVYIATHQGNDGNTSTVTLRIRRGGIGGTILASVTTTTLTFAAPIVQTLLIVDTAPGTANQQYTISGQCNNNMPGGFGITELVFTDYNRADDSHALTGSQGTCS